MHVDPIPIRKSDSNGAVCIPMGPEVLWIALEAFLGSGLYGNDTLAIPKLYLNDTDT